MTFSSSWDCYIPLFIGCDEVVDNTFKNSVLLFKMSKHRTFNRGICLTLICRQNMSRTSSIGFKSEGHASHLHFIVFISSMFIPSCAVWGMELLCIKRKESNNSCNWRCDMRSKYLVFIPLNRQRAILENMKVLTLINTNSTPYYQSIWFML